MNRHQRRARAAKTRQVELKPNEVDSVSDIQVEGKVAQFVMICANAKGRTVVERLFSDVQWATDEHFSKRPDVLFTHVRVTKLPPHLEESVPLAFASPDALSMAVAMELQRLAEPRRVIHWTGYDADLTPNFYDGLEPQAKGLFAEYVPTGPVSVVPRSLH